MPPDAPNRTFWVDVEDLFQYAVVNPRPSGVQRLVFEILRVLPERARLSPGSPRIAFVRHTDDDTLLREVPFESVARLFETLSTNEKAPKRRVTAARKRKAARVATDGPLAKRTRLWVIRQIERLPPDVAEILLQAGILQLNALRYARLLFGGSAQPETPEPEPAAMPPPAALPTGAGFGGRPGDVFLMLGAAWVHPNFGTLLQRLRTLHGLTPALLLHDLIPVRRPEWCAADLVESFATWLETTLPQCPRLLANSHATATDVEAYAREVGLTLAGPVQPVPIGTSFGVAAQGVVQSGTRPRGLPTPGSYVLFVSTLEARKNHALLFRLWRRLLSELPRNRVPTLVFAGRIGWLVADLMQQLENVDWLGGKIRLIRDPSDAELMALYQGCQFTLFPSLFEGWGLPVTESLALGRPCVSSNRESLPEAGGDLARYFDPENIDDAYRTVRAVIDDPTGLEAWRERVAREFRHVPWERSADTILASCMPPDALPAGPTLREAVK